MKKTWGANLQINYPSWPGKTQWITTSCCNFWEFTPGKKAYKHGPGRLHNTHKNPKETKGNFKKIATARSSQNMCFTHASVRLQIKLSIIKLGARPGQATGEIKNMQGSRTPMRTTDPVERTVTTVIQ